MSTTTDLMGVGMPPALAGRLGNTPQTIAGVGTTQTGAPALSGGAMFILTATGGNTAFALSNTTSTGRPVFVWNGSASQTALVYPPSGGKINGGSTNASVSVAPNTGAVFQLLNGAGVAAESWGAIIGLTSGSNPTFNNVLIGGTLGVTGLASFAGIGSSIPQQVYNTAISTSGFTLTGANVCGGSVKTYFNLTGTLGSGQSVQMPTVAALVTAMQSAGLNPLAGSSYELDVMNTSSANFAWTITTNTGWTLTGTMTAAQNTLRRLIITFTTLSAAVAQSVGEYAITAGI